MTQWDSEINSEGVAAKPGDLVGFVSRRLGEDIANKIEEAFGGREVYVPITPEPHNVFTKVVGLEAALVVAKEFGSGKASVPIGSRRRSELIVAACLSGRGTSEIAKSFRCSCRLVQLKRAELRREGRMK